MTQADFNRSVNRDIRALMARPFNRVEDKIFARPSPVTHLALKVRTFGDFVPACGSTVPGDEVSTDPRIVTCAQCLLTIREVA